jgi:hypothetical protein
MIDKNLYLYLSFYTRIFVNFLSQESVGTFGHCGFAQQRTFTCFYLQVYLNPFNCVWFKMKISWDCPLYYCSVDSLLLSRSVDPEEVLLSLGFGGCSRSVARIPPRFFSTKSHVSYLYQSEKTLFQIRTEKCNYYFMFIRVLFLLMNG